jgi:long-chain fatty acid transport protein
MRARIVAVFVASACAFARSAGATPELPPRYSARSLGMGGTGIAFVDDATAAVMNPARLDRIERFSGTLTVTPFLPTNDSPFSPDRTQSSDTQVIPLFFLGAGVRVLPPLTIGLGVYPLLGFGAHYKALPEFNGLDMNLDGAILEGALPVAFRISEELSIGAALRLSYTVIDMDMPVVIGGAGGPARVNQTLSGIGFPGVLLGVSYQPHPSVSLGLTYRSKMTATLEGEGTLQHAFLGEQPIATSSEFSTAHAFALGAAWSPIRDRLLFALDVRFTLLDDAYDTIPLGIDFTELPDTHLDEGVELNWENTLAVMVGAEYFLTHSLAARAGYHITNSGTPADHAGPLYPPPGILQTVHLGAGLRLERVRVDLGGGYAFGGRDVDDTVNGVAGHYGGGYVLFGGSFTFCLDGAAVAKEPNPPGALPAEPR